MKIILAYENLWEYDALSLIRKKGILMFDKMKDLMEMKRQADRLKRELDAASVESQAVSGIKIVINGSQNFQSIEIDEAQLRPENKARFQSDLLKSINAAIRQSQQVAAQKMKEVLPGMPGF